MIDSTGGTTGNDKLTLSPWNRNVRVPVTGRTAPSSERQVVSSCNQASERMDWGRHVANDAIACFKSTVTTPIRGYFMRVDANDRKSSPRRTTGLKILVTARQTTKVGGKVRELPEKHAASQIGLHRHWWGGIG